ncbi:MAG: VWA domain-containing protein [Clostridia bacterium]|nr:VWA domain-containing protein [Clostridia bacterium]
MKTTNNLTEIVCILDKSGSMAGFEKDTVGGFNATISDQKEEEGRAFLTTVFFSNSTIMIHDRIDIREVMPMTLSDYRVGGCTALLDAIGDMITHIEKIHRYSRPEDVPEHTVFVIMTDGMENASHRYTAKEVRKMIKAKEESGWEFIFLAANIDAVETASHIGIRTDRAANFEQSDKGISNCYEAANMALKTVRSRNSLNDRKWRRKLDEEEET